MENFPKRKRGRPRKIPESLVAGLDVPEASREYFAEVVRTDRTHANAYYAEMARGVVEKFVEDLKGETLISDPALHAKSRLGMDWILSRKTVLTELGRMMEEDPEEHDVKRFQAVVAHIATRYDKLSAKAACAYIRRQRLGGASRRDRVSSLHRDLNAAINLHRKRFPESSWEDVQKALDLTAGQVGRKAK
jgi:hypothetical protein